MSASVSTFTLDPVCCRNLDSKKFPDFNVMLKSDVTHNKRHTQADLDLRYGANFKDPNKQVTLSGEVSHKKAPQGAKFNYKAAAVYLPLVSQLCLAQSPSFSLVAAAEAFGRQSFHKTGSIKLTFLPSMLTH